jgi:hypothetical protein
MENHSIKTPLLAKNNINTEKMLAYTYSVTEIQLHDTGFEKQKKMEACLSTLLL